MFEKNRPVIWISDVHSASGLAFVLEDDGQSCWLYLCSLGKIIRSVLAYSPIDSRSASDCKSLARDGRAPVLTSDYASGNAVISERYPDDFSFRWRDDGKAVAIRFRDETIVVVSMEEKYGSSKAIRRSGPFGDPLILERYPWI